MSTLIRLRLFTAPLPARYQLRALHHPSSFCHRTALFSSLPHDFGPSFSRRTLPLVHISSRSISFGSIFSSKSSSTPPPHAVAHVARIEADANTHPHDVEKQLALFQALFETKTQPGYELIINRWERMSEFVRSFWTRLDDYANPAGPFRPTCRTTLRHSFILTRLSSITFRLS